MLKGKAYIGTSGWHYKHWRGTFYPADLPEKNQLATFIKTFKTVEINNSFYRVPTAETFLKWKAAVPDDFVFAVKANRFITHMKKLKNVGPNVLHFLEVASILEEKLGPILFQLPPALQLDLVRLEDFIAMLPKGYRYTFEFRNQTWYDMAVYALLRTYNIAFCQYELDRHASPSTVTADFVYIRLHGPGNKYQGSYTSDDLLTWSQKINQWNADGIDVYIYFDNDQMGYAAFNAKTLLELL